MLMENISSWFEVVMIVISAVLGLMSIAAALNGFFIRKIPVLFRLALTAGGLCMMIPGTVSDLIGFAVLAAVCVYQILMKKKEAKTA